MTKIARGSSDTRASHHAAARIRIRFRLASQSPWVISVSSPNALIALARACSLVSPPRRNASAESTRWSLTSLATSSRSSGSIFSRSVTRWANCSKVDMAQAPNSNASTVSENVCHSARRRFNSVCPPVVVLSSARSPGDRHRCPFPASRYLAVGAKRLFLESKTKCLGLMELFSGGQGLSRHRDGDS